MRAVVFDLDQTLLDRTASLLEFLRWQAAGMLGSELEDPDAFISRFVELDDNGRVWKDEVYRRLIEEFEIGGWAMEELLSVYENRFSTFCVPRLGVRQAIEELVEANYRLGLISNGKTPFQERNFRALGFADHFGSIIVSEAVGLRKPDARIFHLGCSELEVTPEEAAFVGDSPTADIEGAKEAGLRTIFVPSDLYPACEIADETCRDMHELPRVIAKLGQFRHD